jgi:hypothetical protein
MRSRGSEGNWRSNRSRSLTVAAALIASIASAATIAYLDPQSGGTLWHIAAALVVVWVPLLGYFPLSTARLAVASGVWFTVGIPGAYFFGAAAAYAGALMGLLLVLRALAARVQGRGSRSPSPA